MISKKHKTRLSLLWLALWFIPALLCLGNPLEFDLPKSLNGATWFQPLGFDPFGRNLVLVLLRASAVSGVFSLLVVLLSAFLSLFFGIAIALFPTPFRFSCLRVLELTLAFPSLLLALAWAALRGPGWSTLLGSLLIGVLPSFTRMIYIRTRELLSEEFIHAASALGANQSWIALRHLLPALLSICSIKLPGLFAHALIAEATLSFLGVGAPVGSVTWGALLAQGKDYLIEAPRLMLISGLPLILSTLALQVLSESKTAS